MSSSLRIESIKRKSARSPYFLIHLSDGGEPVMLHQDVYYSVHLFEGMEVDQATIEAAIDRHEQTMCRTSAWRLLGKRPRSRLELARSLHRRFPKKVVGEVLDDLQAKGYLNDQAYGELLIGELMNKGSGIQQIRQKARSKGLEKNVVDELVAKHLNPDQQEATARRLLEKWAARSKKYPSPAHKRQAAAQFLARKGYQSDLVWQLVGDLIEDSHEEY